MAHAAILERSSELNPMLSPLTHFLEATGETSPTQTRPRPVENKQCSMDVSLFSVSYFDCLKQKLN